MGSPSSESWKVSVRTMPLTAGTHLRESLVHGLNVDRRDVIGERTDLFEWSSERYLRSRSSGRMRPCLQHSRDEGAGAGERVEYVHAFVGERGAVNGYTDRSF